MVLPPMKSVKVIDIERLSNYITDMVGYSITINEIKNALEITTGSEYFTVKRSDILALWEKAEINCYPPVTIIVTSINIIFSQMISDEMFLLRI